MQPDRFTRAVSPLPPGTALSRFVQALAMDRDPGVGRVLAKGWLDSPEVHAAFDFFSKAAVPAGTTTDALWAGPLAVSGIADQALALLRGASIVGQLEARMRPVLFNQRLPRDITAGLLGG